MKTLTISVISFKEHFNVKLFIASLVSTFLKKNDFVSWIKGVSIADTTISLAKT